jgi:hypothetical protein
MYKSISAAVLVAFLLVLPACKGSTTPEPPAVTVSSITVNSVNTMLKVGQTETFTATANMSNGTQQAARGAWSSSNTGVATVSSAGLVTIVGAGEANIIMTQSGKSGQKGIRGLPDYQGTWGPGTYSVTACTNTGDFIGLCDAMPPGTVLQLSFILTQTQDLVSGTAYLGTLSAAATGQIATNGQVTLTARVDDGSGIVIDLTYTLQSTVPAQITGTFFELWTGTGGGYLGNAQVSCTIISLGRTSPSPNEAAVMRSPLPKNATLQDIIRAIIRR